MPQMEAAELFDKQKFSQLYCLAPEQITTNESSLYYTDVWACGILMYLMFSGNHPFKAQNNFDLCNRILQDEVSFTSKEWRLVSKSAKSLIQGMLVKNPLKRLSLLELLSNKWVRKFSKPSTKPKYLSVQATKNLMLYNSERKLE